VAAVFDSATAAAGAVSDVVASGIVPSLLEFMDRVTVHAVNDAFNMGIDPDAGAFVLAQSDAGGDRAADEIQVLAEIFDKAGAMEVAVADTPEEGELLLAGRRQVLTAMERLGTTMIDDVCVPRSRLADMIARIEKVAEEADLVIGVVGHAGDGNFHPTVVFDRDDADQVARANEAFDEVMRVSLDLGGTITGEHGVGVLKMQLLEQELGPLSLDIHRRIKQALDPQGILNPGKVFALHR
jgi:glycolate oxidase